MDLSDVQKEMVPGALAAIRQGISMEEAREAFTLTLFDVAMKESGNVQSVAARRLGVNPSLVNQAIHGRSYNRFRDKKKAAPAPDKNAAVKE